MSLPSQSLHSTEEENKQTNKSRYDILKDKCYEIKVSRQGNGDWGKGHWLLYVVKEGKVPEMIFEQTPKEK